MAANSGCGSARGAQVLLEVLELIGLGQRRDIEPVVPAQQNLDVDDLKGINDRDGHAAGDKALKAVVNTMRDSLRSHDLILRYGGDEFVAGMSGIDMDDAKQRFDTIQETLLRDAGISISVGLAALSGGETAEELTAQADYALSKIKGRHQRTPSA